MTLATALSIFSGQVLPWCLQVIGEVGAVLIGVMVVVRVVRMARRWGA